MKRSVVFASIILIFLVLIGFISVSSSDLGIGKTVVDKDGIVKVNGNEYNVKTGSQIIVGKDGLTDGTRFTAGKDGGVYKLRGINIKLPENSKVTFKDNEITIEFPDGSKLETLKIIDREKAIGTKFKFSSEKGFKLPNEDLFTGKTLTFEIDKNGKNNLYFSDKESNLDGLKINNPKQERIDIDFKGEVSKLYSGDYLSINNEKSKLIIGKNSPGAGVQVQKQDENVFFQAGKDADKKDKAGTGTIVVDTTEKNKMKVDTYGDFRIDNGELYAKTGLDSKGEKGVFIPDKINKNGKKSFSMEITSYDENGNSLFKKKIVIDDKNGFKIYKIKSENDKTTQATTPDTKSNEEEKPRVSFNAVEAPQQGQTIPQTTQTSQNEKNPYDGLNIGHFGSKDNVDPLTDIKKHFEEIRPEAQARGIYLPFSTYGDVHEGTHALNSYMRNIYGGGTGVDNGFYLFDGNYVILKEPPGVTMTEARQYVPDEMRSLSSYDLYLVQQASSWNNQPLNIMDEYTAYINSEIYKTRWNANDNVVNNAPDFTVYSLALGLAIEQKNLNYWNSEDGTKFKQFLALSIDRAKYADSNVISGSYGANIFKSSNQKYVQLRNFLQRNYPESWIKKTFQ